MDEELKQLAALALRNAFWSDFSALANKYLEAATGLDVDAQERQMGDMTSIYGRDDRAATVDVTLNLWTQNRGSKFSTSSHDCIVDALEHPAATEVHLRGTKVFERRNNEWYFTGRGVGGHHQGPASFGLTRKIEVQNPTLGYDNCLFTEAAILRLRAIEAFLQADSFSHGSAWLMLEAARLLQHQDRAKAHVFALSAVKLFGDFDNRVEMYSAQLIRDATKPISV